MKAGKTPAKAYQLPKANHCLCYTLDQQKFIIQVLVFFGFVIKYRV